MRENDSQHNKPPSSALMSTNWNTLFSKSPNRKIMRTVGSKAPVQLSGVCMKMLPDPRTVTEAGNQQLCPPPSLIPAELPWCLKFGPSA